MREIKFRAWDVDNKIMYHPLENYGDIRDAIILSLYGEVFEVYEESNGDWYPHSLRTLSKNVILEQYTGLKDKNGKEIYEGDIVNFAVKRKICPTCASKKITSELKYRVTRFCPECGGAVKNTDFITKSVVVFNNGGFAFHWHNDEYSYQEWHTYIAEIYIEWKEIIGNIHDNPELIK